MVFFWRVEFGSGVEGEIGKSAGYNYLRPIRWEFVVHNTDLEIRCG